MADARVKQVYRRMLDLSSRTNYVLDLMTSLREPLGRGDVIEVPYISNLTVTADGATETAGQSITTNVLSLAADKHPTIFAELPMVDAIQLMDGSWAAQVGEQALRMLRNHIDEALVQDYIAQTLCYDTSATYHFNVAADALVEDDILNAKAYLMSQDGTMAEDLAFFVNPYGEGSIMSISGFVPNFAAAEQGILGIPKIGSVFGVPVYATNSVATSRTIAASASAISSNVITLTVAAGHGVVPGQKITTAGATTDIDTAAAVTSVTATTIVAPLTACNDASNGAATITLQSTENVMLDKSKMFVASQRMPQLQLVKQEKKTGEVMQVSSVWGRIGKAGHAVVVNSPASAVA